MRSPAREGLLPPQECSNYHLAPTGERSDASSSLGWRESAPGSLLSDTLPARPRLPQSYHQQRFSLDRPENPRPKRPFTERSLVEIRDAPDPRNAP